MKKLRLISFLIGFVTFQTMAQPPAGKTANDNEYDLDKVESRSKKSHKKADKIEEKNNKAQEKANKQAEKNRKEKLNGKKKKEDDHKFNF